MQKSVLDRGGTVCLALRGSRVIEEIAEGPGCADLLLSQRSQRSRRAQRDNLEGCGWHLVRINFLSKRSQRNELEGWI